MLKLPVAILAVAVCASLSSCATNEHVGVPAAIVEDCRREVALLTDRDALPAQEDPLQGTALESLPEPIEDARRAKQDAGASLETWPEEALLYRCFESRGVQLDSQQAEVLDEWQSAPSEEKR